MDSCSIRIEHAQHGLCDGHPRRISGTPQLVYNGELVSLIELVLYRRALEKKLVGYTVETAQEIAWDLRKRGYHV